jgi:hypothetical protein
MLVQNIFIMTAMYDPTIHTEHIDAFLLEKWLGKRAKCYILHKLPFLLTLLSRPAEAYE